MNKQEMGALWESVYRFCYLIADTYYRRNTEICERSGVTKDDLRQESYFAFLKAAEAYEADGQYKFTSYLRYPLRNAFNELCGMRTQRDRKEPLNVCDSLDRELLGLDGDITLGDTVEDKENHILSAEEEIYINQLHDALEKAMAEKCTARERDLLNGLYYEGKTLSKAGERLNCTGQYARTLRNSAFRKLRTSSALQEYSRDIIAASYKRGGFSLFRETGESSTEWAALRIISRGQHDK